MATQYDQSKAFEKDILPLLKKIQMLCYKHEIPFYASFATENKHNETHYENRMLSPTVCKRKLTTDCIVRHALVQLGFVPTMPESIAEEYDVDGGLDFQIPDEQPVSEDELDEFLAFPQKES